MSRPATARLFIALELPVELRSELAAWARGAIGTTLRPGSVRLLAPEAMHLTMRFLGSRPMHEIDRLAAIVEEQAPPPDPATLGAPLWLPARRPRVLAVEVHDPAEGLLALYRALCRALAEADLDPDAPANRRGHVSPPRRTFRPHVTVARMRAGAAPRERELPVTPRRSFLAPRVVLYRSFLQADGARYEPLAEGLPVGTAAPG